MIETVMTYTEWSRIYKKRKRKEFIENSITFLLMAAFFFGMFIYWLLIGY